MTKKAIFLKFQLWVCGRFWPIRSAKVSSLAKNVFIIQFQKLMILSQKNIPPPQKRPFFLGGGALNPGMTWAVWVETFLKIFEKTFFSTKKKTIFFKTTKFLSIGVKCIFLQKNNCFCQKLSVR